MSTRSRIGIKRKDGSIDSIYCHYDGYLHYVGRLLYEYYKNTHEVEYLINLGDISYLEEDGFPNKLGEHSFDFHQLHSNDITSFIDYCIHSDQEYAYLYDEDSQKWLFAFIPDSGKMQFEDLRNALIEKNIITEV